MNYTIINRDQLPPGENSHEFQGVLYQDTEVSFIWVDMAPGGVVRLHQHPYPEIFIVLEGVPTFTVDGDTLEGQAGQIILIHANVPHKFVNRSDQQLRQIDIHVAKQFITHWLED